jgi:hypothetical protein
LTVEQFDVVDIVSLDPESGHVVLTVSDHLDWCDSVKHQQILQRKLNRYLAFVEGGEIFGSYPEAVGRPVRFDIVFKYKPDRDGRLFLRRAREVIESAGFALGSQIFAESWDN